MDDLFTADSTGDDEAAMVELGEAATLTQGQGTGRSEDKRRLYN